MEHPNIARVLEAGTTGAGRPYFVMDLVKGVPITRYCDGHHLTPRQRLELFIPVCQAVQHAHQKGIIHRDLKPSNVLVALYDGKPVPKVIDFGVAKAAGQQLTEKTLVTGFGAIIGSLEYMAPEQAEFNQLDIDTRSDIYSLGVLLYELLTGSPPLTRQELGTAGMLEMLRVIREQEPSKPSTRLSTADGLPTLAANRGTEPAKLTKLVRGELDWIVMKALEKDRTRRYETANGFALDVQRYLADEPVLACPPSTAYGLKKFVRRNKGPVLAGSIIFLLLVGGIVGTTVGLVRAEQRAEGERRAKDSAERRLAQIENGTDVLASVFRDLDPRAEAKEGVTLRVLLGRRLGEAVQQLEGEAVGDPLVVARLQHVLGISLRELGHPEQAEAVLVKARQTRERLLGADHLDTAATKHNLAGVYRDRGKHSQAEQLYKEVLEVRGTRTGVRPRRHARQQEQPRLALHGSEAARPGRAAARGGPEGPPRHTQGRRPQDAPEQEQPGRGVRPPGEVRRGRAAARGSAGHPHGPVGSRALRHPPKQEQLGLAIRAARGKLDEAETLLKEALEASSAELGPRHSITLTCKHNLATVYAKREKYALAEVLVKEVLEVQIATLPADHPRVLMGKVSLAALYRHMKKYDQSIPLFEETLKLERAKFGPDHPETLDTQAKLGVVYRDAGRVADAIPLLEDVHQKGRKHPVLAWVGNALLTAYVQAGKKAEATALVTAQVAAARKQFLADSLPLAAALADVGKALLDAKAYADAEPLLLAGYEGAKKHTSQVSPRGRSNLMSTLERLVRLYDAWDKPDEAAKWRKELEAQKTAAEPAVKPKG